MRRRLVLACVALITSAAAVACGSSDDSAGAGEDAGSSGDSTTGTGDGATTGDGSTIGDSGFAQVPCTVSVTGAVTATDLPCSPSLTENDAEAVVRLFVVSTGPAQPVVVQVACGNPGSALELGTFEEIDPAMPNSRGCTAIVNKLGYDAGPEEDFAIYNHLDASVVEFTITDLVPPVTIPGTSAYVNGSGHAHLHQIGGPADAGDQTVDIEATF